MQACNVGLWSCDSLTPSCTPTTITVTTRRAQENFRIAWEGRIRLMTTIAPAYAHAYQAICLARRPLDIHPYHRWRHYSMLGRHRPFTPMEKLFMFGPVKTTETHLAYGGTRLHINNTAELSSTIEALSFLGPSGPVARGSQACIFFDSKTRCQRLYGNDSVTHERTFGNDESALGIAISVEH